MNRPTHIDPQGNICFPEGVAGAIPLPADFWEAKDLETAKTAQLAKVKQLRSKAERNGVDTPFGRMDTTPESLERLNQAVLAAMIKGEEFFKSWRKADNTEVQMNAAEMLEIGILIDNHFDACRQRKKALDLQVAAATSLKQLKAIQIDSNWP